MKLERAPEYLTTFVAVTVGMFAAYKVGTLSGHGQFGLISGMFASAAFTALLLALREQIWLLIPFSLLLTGQLTDVKGHPAIRDLAVFAVFFGVFALRAFKVIRRKPTYRALDFWTVFVLLYLVTVYVRNPVGGQALGSEKVGGRPYLDVATAALAYWTLARVALPVQIAKRTFVAVASIACVTNLLVIVQTFFPITSPAISQLIGGGGDDGAGGGDDSRPTDADDEGRRFYLAGIGHALTSSLIAGYPPLTLLNPLRIVRFSLFVGALLCTLFAGFRSSLFELGIYFYLTTYLRGDLAKVGKLSLFGALLLGVMVLMQGTIIHLPGPVQRTLSFLPGKWDPNITIEAEGSSKWRFDMWDRMLHTDRYIFSKWFGDGFGMTAMQLQQTQTTAAMNNSEQLKESFLVAGIVHSGPVSTIRYVGYVGLFLFMCLLGVMALEAWRLCRACQGTPYFLYALYICVPAIYHPIGFVLIFGSFDGDLPRALLEAGMLKMLRTSIEEYRAREAKPESLPDATFETAPEGRVPAHLQY